MKRRRYRIPKGEITRSYRNGGLPNPNLMILDCDYEDEEEW